MQIFFKSQYRIHVNILLISVLMLSCGESNNSWKIEGTIENYVHKPVYISIVGKIDSTTTNSVGAFSFEQHNQKSGFVKLALNKNMYPYANLFVDSVSNVLVDVSELQGIEKPHITNSPISVELIKLQAWYNTEKMKYDSLAATFKRFAESTERLDTLKPMYISKLDSLQNTQYSFLKAYITKHINSPEATTASFVSFDSETYKPLLASQQEGLALMNSVSKNMESMYGNAPFVEMYANSVRSLQLQVQP